MNENERVIGYRDIPLYAGNTLPSYVDRENKKVSVIQMSCPWVENREEKDATEVTIIVPKGNDEYNKFDIKEKQ